MEALPPPSGGDQDRGPALMAMWWTELSISIIMVAMRMYSHYRLKNVGVDDWFMVTALVLFISTTIALTFDYTHGGARHLYYLTPPEIEYTTKVTWIENPLGIMAITTAKMSVALLILRLLGPSAVRRKWSLYVTICLTFVIGALACILTFVQCNPPRALWEPPSQVPGAKCWNPKIQANYATFSSAYFTFVDFFLAIIPITFVWNLNLKLQRKLTLCILLGLGGFAGICSAIKATYLTELSARADFTWATYDLAAWTGAELLLLIVCGCIPTLKPIYDLAHDHSLSYFSRLSPSSYSSSNNNKSPFSRKSASYLTGKHASSYHKYPDSYSADGSRGVTTKVTSQVGATGAEVDPWVNEDRNVLVRMGEISVQRDWKVHHAVAGSETVKGWEGEDDVV